MATNVTEAIIGTESGGNPSARNPRSSAAGLGQFIDSTWLAMVTRHRPDIAAGKTPQQILQLKYDPALSREMTQRYAEENAAFLRSRGLEPTAGNLKLAHFAGPQGAAALHANPQASAAELLGARAIQANPFLRGKSGADVIAWADSQMSPSKAMATNLRQRFGTGTQGGAIAGGASTPTMAGGAGMDRLRSAVSGQSYNPQTAAEYENLTKTGQDVASKATNWQQALLGVLTSGVGGYLKGQEGEKKKAFEAAFNEAVQGVKSPLELAQVLASSPDERLRNAGIELLAKTVGQPPQSRTVEGPYGTKVQQDFVDGQWVTAGSAPASAPASEAAVMTQPATVAPAEPQPAPAPSGPMLGGPELPTENIGEVGPSGMPPTPPPAQPQFRIGPAVPKAPDNYVHKLAPDGTGYLYGQDGQPIFALKTLAEEQAKTDVATAADTQNRVKAAAGISSMLGELKMAPGEYGTQAFERAVGPWSASTATDQNSVGGAISAALGFMPQQMARFNAEAERYLQGGAAPTEVRDSVETKLLNLATLTKPFVRKPGEGAWTDADQANLERVVGKASRARDTAEYNRRLDEAERVLSKAFDIKIPKVETPARTPNAPATAEAEVTPWEAYRKQYLGF